MMKIIKAPAAVDINVIGRCNMNCGFCWGPSHEMGEILNGEEWKRIIKELIKKGIKAVIFTGGEPLLHRDIAELIRFTKERGLRITLSTNAILLSSREKKILSNLDEIGVPLDGWDEDSNKIMRGNKYNQLKSALNAIEIIKKRYPQVEITVRTVVCKINKKGIIKIGKLLSKKRYSPNRWKLYEFLPLCYGEINKDKYLISNREYDKIVEKAKLAFPNLYISTLRVKERVGRYFLIMPDGEAFGVGKDGKLVFLGSILYNLEKVLEKTKRIVSRKKNLSHGLRI